MLINADRDAITDVGQVVFELPGRGKHLGGEEYSALLGQGGVDAVVGVMARSHSFSEDVIPVLLKGGASERDIEAMLVTNPRDYFEM